MDRPYCPSDATRAADNAIAERDRKYGEEWRQYSLITLADIGVAKAKRVRQAILDEDWEEAAEEVIDRINYGRFLWCKLGDMRGGDEECMGTN